MQQCMTGPHGADILCGTPEEKNSAQQDQCCDGRSLGTMGVQRVDVPNLDLGVRESSLEQRASVL